MASADEYTTIQQQIESLQGKGLLFDNKERAEVVAVSFGVNHSDYLKFRNYRDRYSSNPKFSLVSILGKLRNIHTHKSAWA